MQEKKRLPHARWPVILWGVIAAAFLLAIVVNLVFLPAPGGVTRLLKQIEGLGHPWGLVSFVAFYVIVCLCLLPGSALTLAAGFMFGIVGGSAVASLGATLGATAAFLISRFVGKGWFERRLVAHDRFLRIDRAIADQGFKIVLLTRLCSLFPYDLTSYAFGLTRIPLGRYVLATWLGRLPETFVWAYIGSTAKSLTDLATNKLEFGIERQFLLGAGLIAMVAVVVLITGIARKALHEATESSPASQNR